MSRGKNCPRVSVVILNKNGGELLVKCIESVITNSYKNIEIIIIDNGSTDQSLAYAIAALKKWKGNYRVLKSSWNLGYQLANNIGIKKASGDYVLLLNNDVILERSYIEKLVKIIQKDQKICGVTGTVFIGPPGSRIIQFGGGELDLSGTAIMKNFS